MKSKIVGFTFGLLLSLPIAHAADSMFQPVNGVFGTLSATGAVTFNALTIDTDGTTGLTIGGSGDKVGFFAGTPVAKGGASTDLGTVLSNFNLRNAGTAYPITTSGAITLTGALLFNNLVTIGSATSATGAAGELAFPKITATGTAPGAAFCKEEWVCGTNAGTGKKIAYCGTSTTPTTIIDNVGGGVTGC